MNAAEPITLGLCMIVKNEAPIIARCLNSIRAFVDYVLIVDTGSTDGTETEIHTWFRKHNIPGRLIQEPWQNFGYNRTYALEQMRKNEAIHYVLMMDADHVLEHPFSPVEIKAFKNKLHHDLYHIPIQVPNSRYYLPWITKNKLPFFYKGVVHEFLDCQIPVKSVGYLDALVAVGIQDSYRNRQPDKYLQDAVCLESALICETDPEIRARYTFYIAQSYRYAHQFQKALKYYRQRLTMAGYSQEIYYSLFQIASLMEKLGNISPEQIIQAYLKAYEHSPNRAEPLYFAMLCARTQSWYQQAYLLGKHALKIPQPRLGLFIKEAIYTEALLYDFSIVAYLAGHFQDSVNACNALLKKDISEGMRGRLQYNLAQATRAMLKNN